jgi:hypothetical protein
LNYLKSTEDFGKEYAAQVVLTDSHDGTQIFDMPNKSSGKADGAYDGSYDYQ